MRRDEFDTIVEHMGKPPEGETHMLRLLLRNGQTVVGNLSGSVGLAGIITILATGGDIHVSVESIDAVAEAHDGR